MRRRQFLATAAGAGVAATAGCFGLLETETAGIPPVPEDRPDGIYRPGHVEGMAMTGTAERGDYAFALTYSYAHRFWNVNGDSVSRTDPGEDDVHLMAVVWDPETETVLPESGLSIEVTRGDELVSQEAIYPMLSQPMGFHYGANFGLDGDGDYTVTLRVGALPTRRTGAFRDRFDEPASVEVPFEYRRSRRDELPIERLGDRAGTRGSVPPHRMSAIPNSLAPDPEALPGRVLGAALSNDARLVATVLADPPAGVDGERYLAVSARTRYNGTVVPAMGLRGELVRDGDAVWTGRLRRTLDPDLGYHYGAAVPVVESGDRLELSVGVQPQTARHEGYETAFGGLMGGMPDVEITA